MKELYPSFAPPEKWRNESQTKRLEGEAWKLLRQKIVIRDNFTCTHCGYRSEKYQIVDHINGDPENNEASNLQVMCQMCNLIKHSGQGCVVQGIVDLYTESKYGQNDIIKITREMRDKGTSDDEIIALLCLKVMMPFKIDRNYLRRLYVFVSSRRSQSDSDMYEKWLEYHNRNLRGKSFQKENAMKLQQWFQ
mgnify:CR=1 FL=1